MFQNSQHNRYSAGICSAGAGGSVQARYIEVSLRTAKNLYHPSIISSFPESTPTFLRCEILEGVLFVGWADGLALGIFSLYDGVAHTDAVPSAPSTYLYCLADHELKYISFFASYEYEGSFSPTYEFGVRHGDQPSPST